jgi:hypothetical protein
MVHHARPGAARDTWSTRPATSGMLRRPALHAMTTMANPSSCLKLKKGLRRATRQSPASTPALFPRCCPAATFGQRAPLIFIANRCARGRANWPPLEEPLRVDVRLNR